MASAIAVALALGVASVAGVGGGAVARAAADPVCNADWPAAPRAFAAYAVAAGTLCWAADPLPPYGEYDVTALVGGRALTARSGSSPQATAVLVARDAATGAVGWQTTIAGTMAMAKPMRDDAGIVVVPAEVTSAVVARDLVSGAERWRAAPVAPTGDPLTISAIVDAGATVYVLTVLERGYNAENVYETVALDRVTGVTRWRRPVRVLRAGTDALLAFLTDGAYFPPRLVVLDPASGVVRREFPQGTLPPLAGFGPDDAGVELVGTVVVSSVLDASGASLVGIDTASGAQLWRRQVSNVPMPVRPMLANGLLHVTSVDWRMGSGPAQTMLVLDPLDGAVRWSRSDVGTALAGADGLLVVAPPLAFDLDPRARGAGEALVLDETTGATVRTLARGPWRVQPSRAAIGGGVVLLGRQQGSVPMGPPLHGDVARFCEGPSNRTFPIITMERSLQALPPPTAAAYVPIAPQRLFDSRDDGWAGYQCPGERLTVKVTGQLGLPTTGVTAVALNLTLVGSGDAGFVTAWPAGEPQPLASALNVVAPRQTRSNFVVLPVAPDGYVSIVTQNGGHLLADVTGYFVARSASTSGRIVSVAPQRLLDTRIDPGVPLSAQTARTVAVAGAAGVPVPAGATAAVVTLTATESAGAGYVTAWPSGSDVPLVSSVNLDGPNQTVANLAIVPFGDGGAFDLFTSTSVHLVVDLVGYVTGDQAPSSATGLFVPVLPTRLFDTRADVGLVPAGWSISPLHAGRAPIPADAASVFVNVTGIGSTEVAHVRIWPTGGAMPLVSSLNLPPNDTRAAATLMGVGDEGRISYWNSAGTLYLAADAMGYVLG